jgi:Mrp family chromosome partitioning ATPase
LCYKNFGGANRLNLITKKNIEETSVVPVPEFSTSKVPVPEFPTSKSVELEMEKEMVNLYQSINSLRSGTQKNKVIQFMSTDEKEGTSTIVMEFAKVAALKYSKSVLLLDADLRKLDQQQPFFNIKLEHSLEETIRAGDSVDKALYQIANSSLFLSRLFKDSGSVQQFLDPSGIDGLLEKLKKRFDFIFIDSPPENVYSVGLATSTSVNGVVLVMDAEKSCLDSAKNITEKITNNGGKLLGVVVNKQRNYIPKFISNRI